MPIHHEHDEIQRLERDVRSIRDAVVAAQQRRSAAIDRAHPSLRRSAVNLVHYVELRRHDVRDLQARLAAVGLSSLGRSEANVLASIEAVLAVLARLSNRSVPDPAAGVAITEGAELLRSHADRLLGPPPVGRSTRIMVTIPGSAADDQRSIGRMVDAGMEVARVNCAHDDEATWTRMISGVRRHPRADGSTCLIAMDLAGPKLRTGPLRRGPQVVKVSPTRNASGIVVAPARVLLADGAGLPSDRERYDAVIPVTDTGWLRRRSPGQRIRVHDARGGQRAWTLAEAHEGGCVATTERTTYVATGATLTWKGDVDDTTSVGVLAERQPAHRVVLGDRIVLTRSLEPVEPTPAGTEHRIGCTLPAVFDRARPGQRVWIDDGKIGGTIERVTPDELIITVTDVRRGGANLRGGKGINLPETELALDALTPKDLVDLDFVAAHADLVNVSFVRGPADVEGLQQELRRRNAEHVGVVLKVENVAAFSHLPDLLLTAMRNPRVGVMIARGDLAVEVGFERLAEVQEEIMWVCEAAHVPVIWATQVLDTLARTGRSTRAEVTDAAMAQRAECVMLNKGPHIEHAIATLDSILCRMHHHQHKKRSLMRRLRAWDSETNSSA